KLLTIKNISEANKMINANLSNSLGQVFGQATKIEFNQMKFERIVEMLMLNFFPNLNTSDNSIFRNISENSLGYNNLIYLATILAEFEGLKKENNSPRILLIEEPEAHLHPQLQLKLLKYLENVSKDDDIQIILTTHSTLISSSTNID